MATTSLGLWSSNNGGNSATTNHPTCGRCAICHAAQRCIPPRPRRKLSSFEKWKAKKAAKSAKTNSPAKYNVTSKPFSANGATPANTSGGAAPRSTSPFGNLGALSSGASAMSGIRSVPTRDEDDAAEALKAIMSLGQPRTPPPPAAAPRDEDDACSFCGGPMEGTLSAMASRGANHNHYNNQNMNSFALQSDTANSRFNAGVSAMGMTNNAGGAGSNFNSNQLIPPSPPLVPTQPQELRRISSMTNLLSLLPPPAAAAAAPIAISPGGSSVAGSHHRAHSLSTDPFGSEGADGDPPDTARPLKRPSSSKVIDLSLDDDDDEDHKMPATKKQKTGTFQEEMEAAKRLQAQEMEQRKQHEHNAMFLSNSGKAFKLVERLIQMHRTILQNDDSNTPIEDVTLVGQDDIVFLAERFLVCQQNFSLADKPTHVSLAYHYTREHNLQSIRQDGLLSHPERQSNGITARRAAHFGDGVYTACNPYGFRHFGNTGLLCAILKGHEERVHGPGGTTNDNINTIIGNKGHSANPLTDEIVLRECCQVLPVLRFSSNMVDPSGSLVHTGNAILWKFHQEIQTILDQFFNGNVPTTVERVTPIPPPPVDMSPAMFRQPLTLHRNTVQNFAPTQQIPQASFASAPVQQQQRMTSPPSGAPTPGQPPQQPTRLNAEQQRAYAMQAAARAAAGLPPLGRPTTASVTVPHPIQTTPAKRQSSQPAPSQSSYNKPPTAAQIAGSTAGGGNSSSANDPFAPIPLKDIKQKVQQATPTTVPATANLSSSSPPSSLANPSINDSSERAKEMRRQNERFIMFTRVLMKYLETKDPSLHQQVKAIVKDSSERNKRGERGYESVTAAMRERLKAVVGDAHWKRAESFLAHFLAQKQKASQRSPAAQPSVQQPAAIQPQQQQTMAQQPPAALATAASPSMGGGQLFPPSFQQPSLVATMQAPSPGKAGMATVPTPTAISPTAIANPPVQTEVVSYTAPASLVTADDCCGRVRTLSRLEDCSICFTKLHRKGRVLQLYSCGHLFHSDCITSALQHDSKCPKCRAPVSKEPQGRGPSGTMTISHTPSSCGGFADANGSIMLQYNFPAGTQLAYHETPGQSYSANRRVAYLPNNTEGRNLLKRFKYAWSRGLMFGVGTSLTTGRSGQVVWSSVHQKSSLNGGAHGFPDKSYFGNVNGELDALRVPPHEKISK